MQKIVLTQEVTESLNFLIRTAESYYGRVNAAQTFQPHIDKIIKSVVEDTEELKVEKVD